MFVTWEVRWSGFTLKTEIWIIAIVNLMLGGTLFVCSVSYAEVILSSEQVVAPCTENSHLEVVRHVVKVLFLIATVGGIEATISASLLFAVYKRLADLVMLWIIVYTCIIAVITASVVVYCYIIITQGLQDEDTSTLLFLIFKDLYLFYSLTTCYAFHSCLKNRNQYITVSTIGSLRGFGSGLHGRKTDQSVMSLMNNL